MNAWPPPAPDRRPATELSPPFFTDLRRQDGRVVVTLHGELDVAAAPWLRETLTDLIDGQGNLSMVLDLTDLAFIDSSGLAALVGALKRMRGRGGAISLQDPPPFAAKLFEVTGVDAVFPVTFTGRA